MHCSVVALDVTIIKANVDHALCKELDMMLREFPAFLGVLTFLGFPATLGGAYRHFLF